MPTFRTKTYDPSGSFLIPPKPAPLPHGHLLSLDIFSLSWFDWPTFLQPLCSPAPSMPHLVLLHKSPGDLSRSCPNWLLPGGLSAPPTPSQYSCPFLTWLCLRVHHSPQTPHPTEMALPPLPEEVQPSGRNLLIPPFSKSTYLHLHTLGWGKRRNAPLLPSGQVLPWVLNPATPIPQ